MLLQIILILAGVVVLMILRVPIAFSFGVGGMVMMLLFGVDPQWAVSGAFKILMSFAFLTLPLYLLLGSVAGTTGIAERISKFVVSSIGRVKGGLGAAVIVTNGVFGAISGAAISALAGIGKAFVPEMEKEGYPRPYVAALLVCSAVLAILIPPSGNMIVFGFMARMPISLCFLAPLIPGLVLMVFLSATHFVMCRRIPSIHVPPKVSFRKYSSEVMKSGYSSSLCLLLPVIILSGIYGGFVTPMEAASVGVFYIIIVGFIYRTMTLRRFANNLFETGMVIGCIVALIFFFLVISRILILERVSDAILAWMMSISTNKWVLMGMLNILMIFLGMTMDDYSATMIVAIILLPVAKSIGFDPYHFAGIAGLNIGLGLITPPVAPLLYFAEVILGVPLYTYIKPVFYYIIFAYLPALIVTIFVPALSTTLPYLFAKVT